MVFTTGSTKALRSAPSELGSHGLGGRRARVFWRMRNHLLSERIPESKSKLVTLGFRKLLRHCSSSFLCKHPEESVELELNVPGRLIS
jgi:hypothetical protein